jgi:hypothetical protein
MLVRLDISDLVKKADALGSELKFGSSVLLDRTGDAVADHLRRGDYWKNRTGTAAGSIALRMVGPFERRLQVRARYASFLDEGTRTHPIRGRRGGVLRFVGRGGVVVRRSVQHPGTRGSHFTERERAWVETSLQPGAEQLRDKSLERVGLAA